MKSIAEATPGRRMVTPCQTTWIEVRLVDAAKRPVPGQRYRIELPDASIMEGTLDDQGKARIDGVMPGQCLVCFPEIDAREWWRV